MKKITHYYLAVILLNICQTSAATENYSALVDAIEEIRIEENISASYLSITTADKILLNKASGMTAHQSGRPFSVDDYIRIGSISKFFTGLAILALESEGTFDINEPIDRYLETNPLDNPWKSTYKITTAQFLEHSAGLKGMSKKEFAFNKPLSIQEAFLVAPKSRILGWPPGFHSAYSNTGAGMAAHVIETLTKDKFENFVTSRIFHPMGLTSATYFLEPRVKQSLIVGYNMDGKTPIPYWHTLYRAFAGINIKPKEMARPIQLFLGKGMLDGKQVFSEKVIQKMETPSTTLSAKSGLAYGYGLGLYHYQVNGIPFIGHGGDADGYLAYFAYSRHLGIGYFVMINAFNQRALNSIKEEIHSALVRDTKPPTLPVTFKLSKTRLKEIKGNYDEATYRFKPSEHALQLFSEGYKIYTQHKGQRRELIPVNEQHFRRKGQTEATIAIVSKGKNTYLQGDIGNFKKRESPLNE